MATDREIIQVLKDTGHLDNPFGDTVGAPMTVRGLRLTDPHVKRAIASYQSFNSVAIDPLIARFHGSRVSAAVQPDGDVGPATRALFDMPRCACPDYSPEADGEAAAAQGSGNWRGCYDVGDFHSVKIKFTNSPPSQLSPHFDTVLGNVRKMYAEMGLLIHWVDSGGANIEASFVQPDGGWIGLAIVSNNSSCSDNIWARFDKNYRPSNIVANWTSLLAHEFGHNCGMGHSSGGIMNSYLIGGLPPTWKGDPSEGLLKARFGGVPVPIPGDDGGDRKLVVAFEYAGGRLEKLYDLPDGDMWPV